MKALTIDQQVDRQIEKGCISNKDYIKRFLKTTSYYVVNYEYEQYLIHNKKKLSFSIKEYEWLESRNERIAKEALSILLRVERIVRNKVADSYSLFCSKNNIKYFSLESLFVSSEDFPVYTNSDKNLEKDKFIKNCYDLYKKKRNKLDRKYRVDNINDVLPFVVAQYMTFGEIRKFFKLLNKDVKGRIANSFDLKISEFNAILEKINFLRNASAHGDFILNFKTPKTKKIKNDKYHMYVYNNDFINYRNKIGLIPCLSVCIYILQGDAKFYKSHMRNILEICTYNNKGNINIKTLLDNLGLKSDTKKVQKLFK